MMSVPASPKCLADRLVVACRNGDVPGARAAIADGALVNDKGMAEGWTGKAYPMWLAVYYRNPYIVALLLSHGADTSPVMDTAAYYGNATVLQLLIDAGGDVNQKDPSGTWLPLFGAIRRGRSDMKRAKIILSHPSADLHVLHHGQTTVQFARQYNNEPIAVALEQEVCTETLGAMTSSCCGGRWWHGGVCDCWFQN